MYTYVHLLLSFVLILNNIFLFRCVPHTDVARKKELDVSNFSRNHTRCAFTFPLHSIPHGPSSGGFLYRVHN